MSLSQNVIKKLKSLHLKKYRQKYNIFIAEGDKIVSELLLQKKFSVKKLYALTGWIDENRNLLQQSGVDYQEINPKSLGHISQLKTPNKVLTVVEMPTLSTTSDHSNGWSIFLDGLQDPGNVGTILRIADWFAIPHIILGPGSVDIYNSKVLQASMGAFLRVECSQMNYKELSEFSNKTGLWAANMGGKDVFQGVLPKKGVLAIGNEGGGLNVDLLALQPNILSIISPKGGGTESLNAAVATGIICAAIRR